MSDIKYVTTRAEFELKTLMIHIRKYMLDDRKTEYADARLDIIASMLPYPQIYYIWHRRFELKEVDPDYRLKKMLNFEESGQTSDFVSYASTLVRGFVQDSRVRSRNLGRSISVTSDDLGYKLRGCPPAGLVLLSSAMNETNLRDDPIWAISFRIITRNSMVIHEKSLPLMNVHLKPVRTLWQECTGKELSESNNSELEE